VSEKLAGLILIVTSGLMYAIEMAGSWASTAGSSDRFAPELPGLRENWMGWLFLAAGLILLIWGPIRALWIRMEHWGKICHIQRTPAERPAKPKPIGRLSSEALDGFGISATLKSRNTGKHRECVYERASAQKASTEA
jgi:hypothetical protein